MRKIQVLLGSVEKAFRRKNNSEKARASGALAQESGASFIDDENTPPTTTGGSFAELSGELAENEGARACAENAERSFSGEDSEYVDESSGIETKKQHGVVSRLKRLLTRLSYGIESPQKVEKPTQSGKLSRTVRRFQHVFLAANVVQTALLGTVTVITFSKNVARGGLVVTALCLFGVYLVGFVAVALINRYDGKRFQDPNARAYWRARDSGLVIKLVTLPMYVANAGASILLAVSAFAAETAVGSSLRGTAAATAAFSVFMLGLKLFRVWRRLRARVIKEKKVREHTSA